MALSVSPFEITQADGVFAVGLESRKTKLSAVGVAGEDEIDAAAFGVIESVGMMSEEDAKIVAGDGVAGLVNHAMQFRIVFGEIDAGDGDGVALVFDDDVLVDEQRQPGHAKGVDDFEGVFTVIVVAEHGEVTERGLHLLGGVDDGSKVAVGGIDQVAGVDDQVGLQLVDGLGDGGQMGRG
jgi:hypothetical protein